MTKRAVVKNKSLVYAFKRYQERCLAVGKKPNMAKFLPEILFRTMRLEDDLITRKKAKALFQS